jgi:hypothetical protein
VRSGCQAGGVLGLALIGAAAACDRSVADPRDAIDAFARAVQAEDGGSLYCLLAGTESVETSGDEADRQGGFGAWVKDRLRGYYEGRDAGWVEPADDGIALVKLLALGHGSFYDVTRVESLGDGAVRARTEVRLGYSSIDLSGFPPGTTLYLCGAPPGRVEVVRVPERGEVRARVLRSADVEWDLVPRTDGRCGRGLAVASVRVLAESVREEDVTWVF